MSQVRNCVRERKLLATEDETSCASGGGGPRETNQLSLGGVESQTSSARKIFTAT